MTILIVTIGTAMAVVSDFTDREVVRSVPLESERVELGGGGGDYAVETATATVILRQAGGGTFLASALTRVLGASVIVAAGYLLLLVVRSLRDGDPFHRANARRLQLAALVVLFGGTAVSVADSVVGLAFATDAVDALGEDSIVAPGTELSFLPLWIGLLLAGLSEVFRRGAAMREELEGLV